MHLSVGEVCTAEFILLRQATDQLPMWADAVPRLDLQCRAVEFILENLSIIYQSFFQCQKTQRLRGSIIKPGKNGHEKLSPIKKKKRQAEEKNGDNINELSGLGL
ncbi:hypothetical protein ElyMa_002314200 [Elysia marginata]|uniref:Uncharacterized protein n=1 Tax=Elysia marginata TaxID=1093978 RepID=A0AAV4G4F1_9GAST|nr:hypothetical protein ElyMa_002314200 [Elysia marginata]